VFEPLQAVRLFGAPLHVHLRVDRNGRATGIHTEAAFGNVEPGARGLQLAATFGL
jgi:hypothetical protein